MISEGLHQMDAHCTRSILKPLLLSMCSKTFMIDWFNDFNNLEKINLFHCQKTHKIIKTQNKESDNF